MAAAMSLQLHHSQQGLLLGSFQQRRLCKPALQEWRMAFSKEIDVEKKKSSWRVYYRLDIVLSTYNSQNISIDKLLIADNDKKKIRQFTQGLHLAQNTNLVH